MNARNLRRLVVPLCALASACSCPRSGPSDAGADGSAGPCALCSTPASGYTCVSDGGTPHCEPILVQCFFQTCEPGEECVSARCQCTPTQSGGDGGVLFDSCLPYGMQCDPQSGRCLLPGDMDWCLPLGGCQPGLDCVVVNLGQNPDNTTFPIHRCAKPCTSNAQCTNPKTVCVLQGNPNTPGLQDHCGWDLCPADPNTGAQPYFQPCAQTAVPSTCIPYVEPAFESSPGAYFGAVGFCIPNGTAPSGGDCNPQGSMQNLSEFCPGGQICLPVGVDGGTCATACNYGTDLTTGQTCPTPSGQCINASGVNFQQAPAVQLGACLKVCDLFSTQPECTPNASGRAFGCQVDPVATDLSTGQGLCLPTIANAPGVGGACDSNATNMIQAIDWPCADRLYCSSLFDFFNTGVDTPGTCMPYCDFTTCPPNTPCPATCPSGGLCDGIGASDAGPQDKTGFCFPPADGGSLPPDAGASDAGTSDAGASDAGAAD